MRRARRPERGVLVEPARGLGGLTDPVEDFTPPEGAFTKVSVDSKSIACGLKTDGSVACWGDPDNGQRISGIYDDGQAPDPHRKGSYQMATKPLTLIARARIGW